MKKIFSYIIYTLIASFIFAQQTMAREYTLHEIYQTALKSSEKIDMARENVYIAKMGKNKAWSLLIPRLTAYGTYNWFTEDKYSSVGGILLQPKESDTWGVRADQAFSLSARELDALKFAGQSITKSEYDLDAAQADFVLAIAASFYDVLKAQRALEIATANLERLTQYHRFVETRVKVGELTKTALLRAQGELSGAKADYLRATNAVKLTRAALVRVAGVENDFSLKDAKISSAEVCELDRLRQLALERADLKSYDMQTKMAERQVKYARGAFWPNVGLFAIYNKGDQSPLGSTFNDESVLGGVSLSFPFFEGGLRIAEYKEAKAKEHQARLAYEDFKKSVDIELRASCLDLETLKGSLKFLEDQQSFAKDNYNAVMKQLENGLSTSLDVMDANTLLLTSEKDVTEALYNYQLAYLKVKRSSGTLLQFVNIGK
jgi:outer membrane protein